MVFWVLYSLAFFLCACFFLWNLVRYLWPQRFWRKRPEPVTDLAIPALIPEIVALQAQFLVAPRMALAEARKMLEDRHAVLQVDEAAEPSVQFLTMLTVIAQSKSYRELRESRPASR